MEFSPSHSSSPFRSLASRIRPGLAFGLMISAALIAFEMFNYSTTDFALKDLLGNLKFLGIPWATILAIAFCGIDFAGIARLFTPEQGANEPREVWYLLGAWLLGATMNAILTWWGVSMAITSHVLQSTAVVSAKTLTTVVPVFVALVVWVTRILIIGTLSVAGERIFSTNTSRLPRSRPASRQAAAQPGTPAYNPARPAPRPMTSRAINTCLLYTSDAADDLLCVDLGGRRIIKKKKKKVTKHEVTEAADIHKIQALYRTTVPDAYTEYYISDVCNICRATMAICSD